MSCVLTGVKQPPINSLIPDKTYVFFSHTIKAQPENMELLDAVLDKVGVGLFMQYTGTSNKGPSEKRT